MANRNTGGPAFPRPFSTEQANRRVLEQDGMSLRDWFAGQSLAAIANSTILMAAKQVAEEDHSTSNAVIAKLAYELADAMLEERASPER